MVKIVYESPDGYKHEERVEGLRYDDHEECWEFYPYGEDDPDGYHTIRKIPRERMYYIEEQDGLQRG